METVLKAFAEMLKPYLKDEPKPIELYVSPDYNPGLSPAEQYAKHEEAVKVFERALLETKWNIEKTMLMVENLKALEIDALSKFSEDEDVDDMIKTNPGDERVKALAKTRGRLQSYESTLAEEQDKHMQQEAYLIALRTRVASKRQDLINLNFGNTAQIRGVQPIGELPSQPSQPEPEQTAEEMAPVAPTMTQEAPEQPAA